MSEAMSKRVNRVYEAINRGDFDAVMEALEPVDPDITWAPPPDAPDTQHVYRGRDEVKKRIMELAEPFAKRDGRVVKFIAAGNRTFIDAHLKGEGRGSQVPFEGHLYQVITSRDPGETIGPRLAVSIPSRKGEGVWAQLPILCPNRPGSPVILGVSEGRAGLPERANLALPLGKAALAALPSGSLGGSRSIHLSYRGYG